VRMHLLDAPEHLLHALRAPEHAVIGIAVVHEAAKLLVLATQTDALANLPDDVEEIFAPKGLRQVVERAAAHRIDGGLDARDRGDGGDVRLRVRLLHLREKVEPAAARHLEIGEHEIDAVDLDALARLRQVRSRVHLISRGLEDLGENASLRALVIDDEDAEARAREGASGVLRRRLGDRANAAIIVKREGALDHAAPPSARIAVAAPSALSGSAGSSPASPIGSTMSTSVPFPSSLRTSM